MSRQKKTPAEKQYAKEIGDRIKRARTRHRLNSNFEPLTRKTLATIARLSVVTLGYYERGEISPGSDAIKRLAKALRVKVSWLLYGSEN